MSNNCPICLDTIGNAYSILKCGHKFCSSCIFDCVALNNEDSRHLCPLCREPMCSEIKPSKNIELHLEDLQEEIKNERIKVKVKEKIIDEVYDLMGDVEDIIENKQKELKKKNYTLDKIKNIISKRVFPKLLGMKDIYTTRIWSQENYIHPSRTIYICSLADLEHHRLLYKNLFEFKSNKNYRWKNKRDWDYHFRKVKLDDYLKTLGPRWNKKNYLMSKIYKLYSIPQLII